MRRKSILGYLAAGFFVALMFTYGVVVGNYKVFPYEQIAKVSSQVKHHLRPTTERDRLPKGNVGLYAALDAPSGSLRPVDPLHLLQVLHSVAPDGPVRYTESKVQVRDGVSYLIGTFTSFDSVEIPYYEIHPPGFTAHKPYPTVILYAGHGDMDQVAFDRDSYQKGLGIELVQRGFLVFTMENRGMGKLAYLGDHKRLDAVARLMGGSWYGQIVSDALYLLQMVDERNFTGTIGVAGVSTGGALSLFVSAIDDRIKATYVQGYLGSYRTTFGTRANHDECNNIPGILNHFDLPDIAASVAPRFITFVNGSDDTFYADDARDAFAIVSRHYSDLGVPEQAKFLSPTDTEHEISVNLAVSYFRQELRPQGAT